jgi:hypothetical protein
MPWLERKIAHSGFALFWVKVLDFTGILVSEDWQGLPSVGGGFG